MTTLFVAMEDALAVVRDGDGPEARVVLSGPRLLCVAADRLRPARAYLGTAEAGLLRSRDGGATWRPAGGGIGEDHVSAVAVGRRDHRGAMGTVWAGTEPSALYRSEDGGDSWEEVPGLLDLPSASTWSFPPRPDTHHVRCIAPDPADPERLFVAVEAGALVRSEDGGRSWIDRTPDGPRDTHTLVAPPSEPGRLHSAAGDGYFESRDGGESWRTPDDGLGHGYLWGCAVDPGDPRTVVVSAARSAREAHTADEAEAWIYRRTGGGPWEPVRKGLPDPEGTTISSLAAVPGRPGLLYAANNRGVFRSRDAGATWTCLAVAWPLRFRRQRAVGLAVVRSGRAAPVR
jgi:photosystem II stability/assembly factor-like uncharacterized protein